MKKLIQWGIVMAILPVVVFLLVIQFQQQTNALNAFAAASFAIILIAAVAPWPIALAIFSAAFVGTFGAAVAWATAVFTVMAKPNAEIAIIATAIPQTTIMILAVFAVAKKLQISKTEIFKPLVAEIAFIVTSMLLILNL
ncbi:hypothetical protein KAJ61_05725 [Candidatus Parcubacteria bacterium]|nr:hypothetical protein [Candidatus Parcubacteria bacterium]